MKTFREKFEEFFDALCESQQLDLVCTYCDNNHHERPFDMDEFDEVFRNYSPMDIAFQTWSDFNPHDKYFHFDGCANLESGNDFMEWVDFDSMADWYEWHESELYRVDRLEWLMVEDEEDEEETEPEEDEETEPEEK